MSSKNTEEEFKNALRELAELDDFCVEVADLSYAKMVERVKEKYPGFIDHIESMDDPPETQKDFWFGFTIWSHSYLSSKYRHIWDKVVHTYFHSEVHKQQFEKWKSMDKVWSQIEKILKNSNI